MIPYRVQRVLNRLGIALLVLLVLAVVAVVCWFLWLQRYINYTRDGAKLDFSLSAQVPVGETGKPDPTGPSISIDMSGGPDATEPVDVELAQFSGYYVTLQQLKENFAGVTAQIKALPKGSTVMLEMKSLRGQFAYTSLLGPAVPGLEAEQVDDLIKTLSQKGYYLIAKVPAMVDYEYFMADPVNWSRNAHGLALIGGNGSLWADPAHQNSFWLNPATDGAKAFLFQIVLELQQVGFDEVVFSHYTYPNSTKVNIPEDTIKVLTETADMLIKMGTTKNFAVSFIRDTVDMHLPDSRSRLYLQNAAASDAATLAALSGFDDPKVRLVFLTDLADTRYDAYSVLRPIEMAR